MNPDAMKSMNRIKENVSEITTKAKETNRRTTGIYGVAKPIHGDPSLSQLARNFGRKMGFAAGYLTRSNLDKMSRDTLKLCRRYPARAMVTAIALGFLIGRTRHG